MAEIDSLSISISSSAKVANDAIDSIIQHLGKLSSALKIDTSRIANIGKNIDLSGVSRSVKDVKSQMQSAEKSVEQSVKKISDMTKEFEDKYKDLGKNFQFFGSEKKLDNEIVKYSNALEKAKIKKEELAAAGKTDSKTYEDAIKNVQKYSNILDSLKAKKEQASVQGSFVKMSDAELDEWFNNLPSIKAQAEAAAQSASESFREMSEPLKGVSDDLRNFSDTASQVFDNVRKQTSSGVLVDPNKFIAGLEEAEDKTKEFESVLDSLKNIQPQINETNLDKLQSKLRTVEENIEKFRYELERGLRFGIISDKGIDNLTIKIRESENTAEMLREKIAEVSKQAEITSRESAESFKSNLGKLVAPEINETNFKKLEATFKSLENKYNELRAKLANDITMGKIVANYDDKGYRDALQNIALVEKKMEAVKAKINSVGGEQGKQTFDGMSNSMSRLANASKSIIVVFNNIGKSARSLFSKLRGLIPSFKELGNSVKNISSRVGKLTKEFTKFVKEHKKTNISLKDGIKMLLKYGIGIRSLFVLFNRLRSAIKEGFNNLVQYSEEANRSVSLITSALGAYKNSLAVAFAPILNAVAPLITRFINMMIDASNAVARFFAALQGKTIATQAKKYYKDYADSLNGVSDAAKKASKALHTLGIDELNIINETDEATDDQISIEDMFEDVKIEGKIADWAKGIRDAFLNHDWEGLGKNIADLINRGLKRLYDLIKWDNIGDKLTNAIKAFAETFNSLVDNLDWDLLGRTIGAGIDTLAHAFNVLAESIDFENLGRKLSVGLRGLVDEIDWVNLGNALGNAWMISWRILDGFISDMMRKSDLGLTGFQELGIALGNLVNGIFEKVNFTTVGRVLAEGLNGIFQIIDKFAETVRFKEIAYNLRDGINTFINLANMGDWGAAIGKSIREIVSALNELVDVDTGIDFTQFGSKIADMLRNAVTSIDFTEIGNLIGNGFMIAWRVLDGFLTKMAQVSGAGLTGWAELGIAIGNAVNGIFEKIDFSKVAQVLVDGFNGIIEALRHFIDTVNWEDISTNLTNGLNTLVHGIDWEEAGRTLSDFVKELLGVFQRVAHEFDWEGFGRSVGEFLSSINWWGIIGQVFDTLWTVFSSFISGLFDTSSGKVIVAIGAGMLALETLFKGEKIISAVISMVNVVKEIFFAFSALFSPTGLIIAAIVAGGLLIIANWDKIKDAVKSLWDNVLVPFGNFLRDIFAPIWDRILRPALEYIAENVIPNLIATLRNFWDNVLAPLGTFIVDVFTPVFGFLADVLVSLWQNVIIPVADAVGGLFASAFKMLWTILNDLIIPVLKSIIGVLQTLWDSLMKPIVEWVRDMLGPILEKVFSSVGGTISNLMDILAGLIDFLAGVIGGLGDVLSTMIDTVAEILGNFGEVFHGIIDFIAGVFTGDWERAWNGVVEIFKGIFNLIPTIAEGVVNSVIGFINGIIHGINNLTGTIGIPSIPDIPKVSLPRFALGGFPEDGLFLANHTELVGKFTNGQTAVANNEQIVEGIKQGVMEAVGEMLAPYLADIARNTRETAEKDFGVSLDGRVLVSELDNRRNRNGWSFATQP